MYQLKKMLRHPGLFLEHKHADTIAAIIKEVERQQEPLMIVKVKAHAGIVGNEEADELAKKAGNMMDIPRVTVGERSRKGMYWVAATGKEGTRTLDDLRTSLKATLTKAHELGKANQGAIYYRILKDLAPTIHAKWSTTYMRGKNYDPKHVKAVFQYRTGTLPTNKLLHRMKISPTPMCPLCGELDGGTHLLMECQGMENARTERHHQLARMTFRAIARGRKGGYLKMVDIGTKEKRKEYDLDHIEGSVPKWLFPKRIQQDEKELAKLRRRYRPDGLLIEEPTGAPFWTPGTIIYIVEFKLAQDSKQQQQAQNAKQQHEEFADMLRKQNYMVEVVPLILGISGLIYHETIESLKKLGVRDQQLADLLEKLNTAAARWVHQMRQARLSSTKDA
jgi:hypothetical protein